MEKSIDSSGQKRESNSQKGEKILNETIINTYLKSWDKAKRDNAVMFLEKHGNLTHIRTLMKVIKTTQDKNLKKQVALASARIIKRNLLNHYSEISVKMRRQLVEILKKLDPHVLESIAQDLNSKNENIRFSAIRILALMGKNPYLRVLISRLLTDSNQLVRATAVSLLKNMPENADMPVLSALLKDKDNRVVANCIEVIDSMKKKRLVPLLEKFKAHPHNRIRANALKALWSLGYDKGDILAQLKRMLKNKENFLLRASACWVIGECAQDMDLKFLELLHSHARDCEKLVRENVIKAQFKIGGEAIEVYQKNLSNPKEVEEIRKLLKD
jgi:HEAT repeat protein